MNAILTVQDLVAGYQSDAPIVNGVSLAVQPGEILTILGPNGAGKSTLIKAIAGIVPTYEGRLLLQTVEITSMAIHERVRAGLAFVPQTENIFTRLSVHENLVLGAAILPSQKRQERLAQAYEAFADLYRQRKLLAGHLSGGQRQMLAIARALLLSPTLLVLDEPSAGLSPKMVADVFAALAKVRDSGVALVLVEQNVRAALAIADRACLLVQGRSTYQGDAKALAEDPQLSTRYLGVGAVPLSNHLTSGLT